MLTYHNRLECREGDNDAKREEDDDALEDNSWLEKSEPWGPDSFYSLLTYGKVTM